jgi:hypothetical protein
MITTKQFRLTLLAAGPVLFALLSLVIGKKTGWDFFNYHWYNPFALLHSRFEFDTAVAHHATYYNPLSDVPLYLVASYAPAWLGGVFTGAMAGVVVSLIGAIAYYVLPISNARHRLLVAALIALLGGFGAGAFQEIGDPANDVPAAIGSFVALLILIARITTLEQATVNTAVARVLFIAGFCAGAAVGLKLTAAIYALGIGIALFTLTGKTMTRVARVCIYGAGSIAGLLLFGGFWMLRMWRFSGNPFFPYFNDVFHSPLLIATGYLDPSFRPDSWTERLLFPFYFTSDSGYASESSFRDAHVLVLYCLIPLTLLIVTIWRRTATAPASRMLSSHQRLLFTFAGVSYLAWLSIFDIYRYLIPLEMLSPLLIAMAYSLWPVASQWRVVATVVTLVILQLLVKVDVSDRQSWQGPYVQVNAPTLPNTQSPMILMTGHEPMAFVIPFFQKDIPFIRIDGWLVHGSDKTTGFSARMHERVAAHDGALYVLFAEMERAAAIKATHYYGLALDTASADCSMVTSNIAKPLTLCPAHAHTD